MRKIFLTLAALVLITELHSQANSVLYYWIKFTDKNNNTYSLSNPSQFLSQASINRRINQGIAVDATDLPVSQAYIDSISPYIIKLVHRLKWFNAVVVELGDTGTADSAIMVIKQFPFIDSVAQIIYPPPSKSLLQANKFESITPVNQNIVYPNVYGAAYHQLNEEDGDLLHQMGYRGAGITIAMMDNGCNGIDTVHAFDSVHPRILGTWNFVFDTSSILIDPLGGHGTYTFSSIAANWPNTYIGAAPDANYYLFQTEDNNAEWIMEEYHWAAAAEMGDSLGAQIFSTSLGYTVFDNGIGNTTYAQLNGNTTVMTQAGNIAFSKGILVFNSAGNEGFAGDAWHYIIAPADGDSIMAVGSVDSDRLISNFSSRGFWPAPRIKPDICAMGHSITFVATNGGLSAGGGTSFSCPIDAGCAACLWQAFPQKTAKEIYSVIKQSADHFNNPDTAYGWGIPSFYDAYLMLESNYNGNIVHINSDMALYPNPFSNILNISLYCDTPGTHTLELFDAAGKKVWETELQALRANNIEIITLNNLGSILDGEYVLRFDKQKSYSHKIIKINTE